MTLDQLRQWLQSTAFLAADTMNIWRDAAVTALAGLVIVCLYIAAAIYLPEPH